MRPAFSAIVGITLVLALQDGPLAPSTRPDPAASTGSPLSTKAPGSDGVPAALARDIAEKLAREIEDDFVFPERGRTYAAMLRAKAAAGIYDHMPSAEGFADAVTRHLQAVHPDGHLRLFPPSLFNTKPAVDSPLNPAHAVGEPRWLGEGVAYIALNQFPGTPASQQAVAFFLKQYASARAVVFDLREHSGGGFAEMDLIFAELFGEPTPLLSMEVRKAVEDAGITIFSEGPTVQRVSGAPGMVTRRHFAQPGPDASPLRLARVVVLTSARTASAGEDFALSLKRTGRATIIGETTKGAGHLTLQVRIHDYVAAVPIGRTFDPDTNLGWEGTGVTPHIVEPAATALARALDHLGLRSTGAGASGRPR